MLAAQADKGFPLTTEPVLSRLSLALTAAGVKHSVDSLLRKVRLARDIRLGRGNASRLMLAAGREALRN